MKRVLFTILSISSLLACLVSLGIWIRSYIKRDFYLYARGHRTGDHLIIRVWSAEWGKGRIGLSTGARDRVTQDNFTQRFYWVTTRPFVTGQSLTPLPPWTRIYRAPGFALDLTAPHTEQVAMASPSGTSIVSIQTHGAGLVIPCWFPAALTAILPGLSLLRWRRKRLQHQRLLSGLCPTCAYDLRASAERCPECGQPIAPPNGLGPTG